MLLSYLLLVFALTSYVTAWGVNLLGNQDPRLIQDGYYFYRVMSPDKLAKNPSWQWDKIFDDVIQFASVETHGDSAKIPPPAGVSAKIPDVPANGVSAIIHFRLQRKLLLPSEEKYRLYVPNTYDKRLFTGPWSNMGRDTILEQNRNGFLLTGFWGGSRKLPVAVSNFRQA